MGVSAEGQLHGGAIFHDAQLVGWVVAHQHREPCFGTAVFQRFHQIAALRKPCPNFPHQPTMDSPSLVHTTWSLSSMVKPMSR